MPCVQLQMSCFSGANFDTHDDAKLGQLEDIERMLLHEKKQTGNNMPFAGLIDAPSFFVTRSCLAFIWGDFNNRLVAFNELGDFVSSYKGKPEKFELTDAGVEFLVDMIKDPARRCELLSKDSLCYEGTMLVHSFGYIIFVELP